METADREPGDPVRGGRRILRDVLQRRRRRNGGEDKKRRRKKRRKKREGGGEGGGKMSKRKISLFSDLERGRG